MTSGYSDRTLSKLENVWEKLSIILGFISGVHRKYRGKSWMSKYCYFLDITAGEGCIPDGFKGEGCYGTPLMLIDQAHKVKLLWRSKFIFMDIKKDCCEKLNERILEYARIEHSPLRMDQFEIKWGDHCTLLQEEYLLGEEDLKIQRYGALVFDDNGQIKIDTYEALKAFSERYPKIDFIFMLSVNAGKRIIGVYKSGKNPSYSPDTRSGRWWLNFNLKRILKELKPHWVYQEAVDNYNRDQRLLLVGSNYKPMIDCLKKKGGLLDIDSPEFNFITE